MQNLRGLSVMYMAVCNMCVALSGLLTGFFGCVVHVYSECACVLCDFFILVVMMNHCEYPEYNTTYQGVTVK